METVALSPDFREAESPPPMKDCPKAKAYEEHPPHTWTRETPAKRVLTFHCDGILPVAEQPPCQVYISPAQPECGKPAPTFVRVKTSLIDATVDVCREHKAEYDQQAASRRNARREQDLKKAS